MQGTITTKDILLHPLLIVSEYGPACYLRCLAALARRRPTTFLDVVFTPARARVRR